MLIAAGAAIIVLIVLAIVIVNREDASRAGDDARVAIIAEGTLSAAAAVENAASQVLLAVTIADAGDVAANNIVAASLAVLDRTVNELDRRFDVFVVETTPDEQAAASEAIAKFNSATSALVAAAESADVEAATVATVEHTLAYGDLVGELAAIRDEHVKEVLLAGQGLGRVADAVRFLIFFLVPLILIIGYRRGAKQREDGRRLEAALEHQRALTLQRDEFIADLSHELRTPLTGIYGFALALQEISELNEEEHDLVTLIVGEAVEMNRMVDDLIVAGRSVAGTLSLERTEVPVAPLVSDTVAPFRDRGVDISVDSNDVSVMADRMALRHILVNLLSNAHQHGGDSIMVELFADGDDAVIRVTDDGPGVPDDVRPMLFGRYLHGRGGALVRGSIGLGTAVVQTYTEAFGGSIEYRRDNGRTVFEVRLPAVVKVSADTPTAELV